MPHLDLRPARPTAARELQQLARLVTGEPRAALRRLLTLVCEQLAMDVAFVAGLTPDGGRDVREAVGAGGAAVEGLRGRSESLAETWCGAVLRDGWLLVADVCEHPELLALPATAAFGIASYAGVEMRDEQGRAVGTLCAFGHQRHATLNTRDRDVLVGLAEVIAPLLGELDDPRTAPPVPALRTQAPPVPAPPIPAPPCTAPDLAGVAAALGGARDVEQLNRPLLDALHELTGLASSYLTVIHEDAGVQELRYTRNSRPGFTLQEGLLVPWEDTLCKRSLDEGRQCTTDVPAVWGDSQAACDLGIQVYVSVPVSLSDGRVWGTLCGADSERADDAAVHLPTRRLFARLIGAEVERDLALTGERARAEAARQAAETDALTGCASRRVVEPWLVAALAELGPEQAVIVAYVDVDDFKAHNDDRGHAAGDAVLVEVGRRLRAAARPHDLVARLGGDEFVVAAVLPRSTAAVVVDRVRRAMDFSFCWDDRDVGVRGSVGAALSDADSTAAELLAAADREMYVDKRT